MSDASVRAALRSDERLVVIEAPAGCGRTHQGADYVLDIAGVGQGRVLILTHTHAACSVFAERTRRIGSRVEIRTIDGLIGQVAGAYHLGLGLPADTATWARRNKDGYAHLAAMVSAFMECQPMIAAALARRYPMTTIQRHGAAVHIDAKVRSGSCDPDSEIFRSSRSTKSVTDGRLRQPRS
jgi:hypothetical protein